MIKVKDEHTRQTRSFIFAEGFITVLPTMRERPAGALRWLGLGQLMPGAWWASSPPAGLRLASRAAAWAACP